MNLESGVSHHVTHSCSSVPHGTSTSRSHSPPGGCFSAPCFVTGWGGGDMKCRIVLNKAELKLKSQVRFPWTKIKEISGVRFPEGLGIFLFGTVFRTVLGPTQPPIQRVPGVLSLGIKRQGRESDHSPPYNAEDKNARSYTSTPPIHLHGGVPS